MSCKCGYIFNYSKYFGKPGIYLVDANIIIYALEKEDYRNKSCRKILNREDIATTRRVLEEVHRDFKNNLKIYTVRRISKELRELRTNTLKQPSEADLSLIQAAIDHPEVAGIITYDKDFKNIATAGLIQIKSSHFSPKFWVGNAREFLEKHKIGG